MASPSSQPWTRHPSLAYLYFHKNDIAPALAFGKQILARWSSSIMRRVSVLFALHHFRARPGPAPVRSMAADKDESCAKASDHLRESPGLLPSRRLQEKGKQKTRSTLRGLLHPLKQFGWIWGALSILNHLMGRLSPSLGLCVYDLMVQPITSAPLLRPEWPRI